jgi:hypothetical protein
VLSRRILTLASTLAVAVVAAVFVATSGRELGRNAPLGDVVDEAVTAANTVSGAKAVKEASYLGFDTYKYPGDDAMRAWRHDDVPYEWVGYYLPAPCHKGTTWVGKRERLTEMGWGIAVVYVGQQTWSRTPRDYETTWRTERRTVTVPKKVKQTVVRNGKKTTVTVTRQVKQTRSVRIPQRVKVDQAERPLDECNANLLSAVRGVIEGNDAIARATAEGFARGSVVFLDIERMDRIPPAMRDYYRAWTRQLLADGTYVPGYYTHKANAAAIYADVKAEYATAGETREPPFWVAGGSDFAPERSPGDVGHAFTAMWQGVLDVVQEWQGFKLPIDVNLSYLKNPSAPLGAQ